MIGGVATSLVLAATAAGTPAPRPATIPALREWHGGSSGLAWTLRPSTRVVARSRGLRGEARTLAHDLHIATARRAYAGDIVMARRPGPPREGYTLRIGPSIHIVSSTRAGAFYGGRTLLQLAGAPVLRGVAKDAPRYPERGLMIDDGRAFFSRAWLGRAIRRLGRLKLNRLHLHLSDDQGFRIQSDSHPEAVTPPALSHADVAKLVAVGRRNHVRLVPEIDMPGHLTAALRTHPELELTNAAGQRQAGKLDVSKPAARRFALDLIDEYQPLFEARVWHMGADEYLGIASTPADYELYPQLEAYADAKYGAQANGKDAVIDFVNTIGDRLRARGVKLRVWSDGVGGGSATTIDPRTSVEWWDDAPGHSPAPGDLIAAGHQVVNTGWWPLYYVTGGPLKGHRTPVAQMYENWDAWEFDGEFSPRFGSPTLASEHALDPAEPAQRGAYLAVWNDDPASPDATEAAVFAGTRDRLRVLAQKTWGSPQLTDSYAEFAQLLSSAH
jgi:hexosaminidase